MILGHPSTTQLFEEDSGPYLIVICDRKVKVARTNIDRNEETSNIRYYENYHLQLQNKRIIRSIKEIIQICDEIETKKWYTKEKYLEYHDLIDI